jgi:hypothetical protein
VVHRRERLNVVVDLLWLGGGADAPFAARDRQDMVGRSYPRPELLIDRVEGVEGKRLCVTQSNQDDAIDDRPDSGGVVANLVMVGTWLKNLQDAIQVHFVDEDLTFGVDVANTSIGRCNLYLPAPSRCFAEGTDHVVALVGNLCLHRASPIV